MFITVLVGVGISGHSQAVKISSFALMAVALMAIACSSATSADNAAISGSGHYTGGQTGSLIPNCGLAPGSRMGSSVPSGQQAFVLYTEGCPGPLPLSEVTVSNANGDPIQVATRALGNGAYLVTSPSVLEQGRYDVTLPQGADQRSASIQVAQPAPLPTRIGQLALTSGCGSIMFQITIDPALLPYLPLTEFSYSIDGGPALLASAYGALAPVASDASTPNPVQLSIAAPRCDRAGFCLATGSHTVTVSAAIAGENSQPDPLTDAFSVDCPAQARNDNASACDLTAPTAPIARRQWAWTLGLLVTLFGFRARRLSSVSHRG